MITIMYYKEGPGHKDFDLQCNPQYFLHVNWHYAVNMIDRQQFIFLCCTYSVINCFTKSKIIQCHSHLYLQCSKYTFSIFTQKNIYKGEALSIKKETKENTYVKFCITSSAEKKKKKKTSL